MQVETEIAYLGITKREDLDELIREKVRHLERINGTLIGCRVTLDKPHHHQRKGTGCRVQVDMTLPPRRELVVSEQIESSADNHDEHLVPMIHRAFEKAERRLQKTTQKQRGEAKQHPTSEANGFVHELFEDHGFLRGHEDQTVYFHKNSVVGGGFERLKVGSAVRFTEEEGHQGPQASTVHIAH